MATTITPATLTITITETISLNGKDQGSTNTQTILLVTEVDKRIVEIPTSEVEFLAFAATVPASGSFNEADVRYIRIRNLDDTNFVTLTFKSEGSAEFATVLDAGQTFIYGCDNAGGVVNTMDASATALTVSLEDLVNITALADTAAVDLEYFIAGV